MATTVTAAAWLTAFNTLRDASVRRQDTIHRVRKLQEQRCASADDHAAFSTVLRMAVEDHVDAVRSLAQHAATAPLDHLKDLPDDQRTRLAGRMADAGAEVGEPTAIAAGLALGASPYPLLARPNVVARDDLLDLVLTGSTAKGLNDHAKDQATVLVWETVVLAYNGAQDDEQTWIGRLASRVLPRLAQVGADLDRPSLGAAGRTSRGFTPSAREQRAHVLNAALVRHRADVLRDACEEVPMKTTASLLRRRL